MLIALLIGLTSATAIGKVPSDVCEVGRLALNDIAEIHDQPSGETFYNGRSDEYHHDVLSDCPGLESHIPKSMKIADGQVFNRLKEFMPRKRVVIFDVETPIISDDTKTATAIIGYRCNGMCGGRYKQTYTKADGKWRRVGNPQLVASS